MPVNNETKWLLRSMIALAKRNLSDSNNNRENVRDWPAGQTWNELGHTSQHAFIRAARKEAGIPHEAYRELIDTAIMSDSGNDELDAIWREMDCA